MISKNKERITISVHKIALKKIKDDAKKQHKTVSRLINEMMYEYIYKYLSVNESTERDQKELQRMIEIAKTPWLDIDD